jgi:nucleoside 2-deoxyribosyltransferase
MPVTTTRKQQEKARAIAARRKEVLDAADSVLADIDALLAESGSRVRAVQG